MSTGYKTDTSPKIKYLNRFAELAKLGEVVFHTDDLANLWGISNPNTLYTTIKRYAAQGLLHRIYKGFYAIKDPKEIDLHLIGLKALHTFGYVSTETILAQEGIIQQAVPAITLISSTSKRFTAADQPYLSRKLDDKYLYQSQGIVRMPNGVRKATPERAIADLLYFNPKAYFDAANHIDWQQINSLQKEIGYNVTTR